MDSKDLIKAGRLSDARKQLTEEVKTKPGDSGRRTLLFQVLAFYGEWDKAERHLDAIGTQDVAVDVAVQVYKNLIHAERERTEVCKLKRRPSFLSETPSYLEMYYAAQTKIGEKNIDEAKLLLDQVEAQRPVISGTVNGKSFTGFKDTDTFLSLFLEAIVHERYVWIPFEAIRELVVSAPKTLFDLLWITTRITTWDGLTMNCYLPVLYPNSFLHEDDRIKLGRMTDWFSLGGQFTKGIGQHVFQAGEEDISILEIREALFNLQNI
ncbi:MAG: hypothetical protein LWX54_01250 [Deltaproteobacteria bacterium]|jgi:type VI secretion system protein ImpE|nr:hypothetical protein [Deltaproteobacteria bacterium]